MLQSILAPGAAQPRGESPPHALVAGDLTQVETVLTNALAPFRAQFGPLIDHLRHYRGKRLRPLLLLLTAKACGQVQPAHHILGAAVEMIHTATLVHDDVLDEAATRRHARTINADHGNQISILLGDLLFSKAFHLSSSIGDARACQWIGAATNRVCAGELRQVSERGNLALREEDYFAIVDGKTAALTECCCRLGAVYADADPDIVERMAAYGRHLGIAFQIADDVLDLVGNEEIAGKTLGTDLEQGKVTLPIIALFDQLPADQSERLRRMWREGDRGLKLELERCLRETQAVQTAQHRAEREVEEAVAHLSGLERTPFRECLIQIAQWSVHRQK